MNTATPADNALDHSTPRVLVVSSDDHDQHVLEGILDPGRWKILRAFDAAAARGCMAAAVPDVILVDYWLPDGTWLDLLEFINAQGVSPSVVVMSHAADERLWAEVLNRGGFDVLSKPLLSEEASRVLAAALRWRGDAHRKDAAAQAKV